MLIFLFDIASSLSYLAEALVSWVLGVPSSPGPGGPFESIPQAFQRPAVGPTCPGGRGSSSSGI